MTKILTTNEIWALGEAKISGTEIMKLKRDYMYCFGSMPDVLRMAPDARRDLEASVRPDELPAGFEWYFGMTPETDGNLREGEWMVGKKNTVITVR